MEALKGKQIATVACGAGHTAALTCDAAATLNLPVLLAVVPDLCHTCVLGRKSGELYMWGRGRHGQLGRGDRTESQASKVVLPEVRHPSCVFVGYCACSRPPCDFTAETPQTLRLRSECLFGLMFGGREDIEPESGGQGYFMCVRRGGRIWWCYYAS